MNRPETHTQAAAAHHRAVADHCEVPTAYVASDLADKMCKRFDKSIDQLLDPTWRFDLGQEKWLGRMRNDKQHVAAALWLADAREQALAEADIETRFAVALREWALDNVDCCSESGGNFAAHLDSDGVEDAVLTYDPGEVAEELESIDPSDPIYPAFAWFLGRVTERVNARGGAS